MDPRHGDHLHHRRKNRGRTRGRHRRARSRLRGGGGRRRGSGPAAGVPGASGAGQRPPPGELPRAGGTGAHAVSGVPVRLRLPHHHRGAAGGSQGGGAAHPRIRQPGRYCRLRGRGHGAGVAAGFHGGPVSPPPHAAYPGPAR